MIAESSSESDIRFESFRRKFSWVFTGNVVYAACQWGMIAVLAKLGSAESVGEFSWGMAISAPIILFAALQLRGVQATDAANQYTFPEYFSLHTCMMLAAFCIVLATTWMTTGSGTTLLVVVAIGMMKTVDATSEVIFGYFQRREQMKPIAVAQMCNGVISLVMLATVMAITGSLILAVISSLSASILTLALYTAPHLKSYRPQQRWISRDLSRIILLFRQTLPLGFVMLTVSLSANVPRYVVSRELGQSELGIFSALAYLIVAGATVVSTFGQTVSPRLSRLFSTGDTDSFRSIVNRLILAGLGVGLVSSLIAALIGREVITALYSREYAENQMAIVLTAFVAGISFAASFAGFGLTSARMFTAQVPISLAVLVMSVVGSLFLVQLIGLNGAIAAVGIASLVQLLGSLLVIQRCLRSRDLE
jgi:O-antigen/teichoic acid export membrane protein